MPKASKESGLRRAKSARGTRSEEGLKSNIANAEGLVNLVGAAVSKGYERPAG